MKILTTIIDLYRGNKFVTAAGHGWQAGGLTALLGLFGMPALGAFGGVMYFLGREVRDAEIKMEQGVGKGAAVWDGFLDYIGPIVFCVATHRSFVTLPDALAAGLFAGAFALVTAALYGWRRLVS